MENEGNEAPGRVHPAVANKEAHIANLKASVEEAREKPKAKPIDTVGSPAWHKSMVEKTKATISPKQY